MDMLANYLGMLLCMKYEAPSTTNKPKKFYNLEKYERKLAQWQIRQMSTMTVVNSESSEISDSTLETSDIQAIWDVGDRKVVITENLDGLDSITSPSPASNLAHHDSITPNTTPITVSSLNYRKSND
eukprot:UN28902